MTNSCACRSVLLGICTAVAATLATGGAAAQTGEALSRLTAPVQVLPSGCRVRPYEPARQTAANGAGSVVTANAGFFGPFPDNPWVGTDPRLLNILLGTDTLPVPDGPPPTVRELRAMQGHAVQHVREGYRAVYDSPDGSVIEVRAMRFDAEQHVPQSQATPDQRPSRAIVDQFAIGVVVVHVTANPETGCSRAIDAYLRALR